MLHVPAARRRRVGQRGRLLDDVTASRQRLRGDARRPALPPLRLRCYGRGDAVADAAPARPARSRTRSKRASRLRLCSGRLWHARLVRSAAARRRGDAGRVDRGWETHRRAAPPGRRSTPRRAPPRLHRAGAPRRATGHRRPSWCWPPISSSSRRPAAPTRRARARAAGDEVRTVIAGYHWFTDWGRDTMISLEGLTLTTGPAHEAGYILRTFAHYVRDGLIPNMFPEGERRGPVPHGRRHALVLPRDRPLPRSDRRSRHAPPAAAEAARRSSSRIISAARGSASASIRRTACCARAQQGYQLTWMDAKVGRLGGDAAPRQGGGDQRALVQRAAAAGTLAARSEAATRRRRRLRDSTRRAARARASRSTAGSGTKAAATSTTSSTASSGDDAACRPNQVFAISLAHPVLEPRALEAGAATWSSERLLTPVGLRSLAPGHPDYKPQY